MAKRISTRHSKRNVRAQIRAKTAAELRADGKSYPEIAKVLGVATSTAWRAVIRETAKVSYEAREEAERILATEWEITEQLLDAAMPAADAGDMDAVRTVLRILDRRSRYRGFDAPTAFQAEVAAVGVFTTKEQMYLEVLERINAATITQKRKG